MDIDKHYRSVLFVPGNRPDRFEKACASDADLVCIDLEDAVGALDKDSARAQVLSWLAKTHHNHVALRINPIDSALGRADISALSSSGLTLPFIMIPKAQSPRHIDHLDAALPAELGPFFTIIESAKGLVSCDYIFAHERVKFGMYGAVDYAADVDCGAQWEAHLFARSKLVASACAFNVQLFDSPHVHVRDLEDCEASTRTAKALGIHARSAIHPAQIARIHAALAPSAQEIDYAKAVIAASDAAKGNVALLDGQFIEEPVVKKARRILSRL